MPSEHCCMGYWKVGKPLNKKWITLCALTVEAWEWFMQQALTAIVGMVLAACLRRQLVWQQHRPAPSVCFLDSRAWSLDHVHMFASLHCDSRTAMGSSRVQTTDGKQLTHTSICLISGHLSVIVRSWSHFCIFGLWDQTSVANSWLIPPSVCFLNNWVWLLDHAHMFGGLNCESRPALA